VAFAFVHIEDEMPASTPEAAELPDDGVPELLEPPPDEPPELLDAPPEVAPELLELTPEEAPEVPEPSPNDPDPPGAGLPSFELEHATTTSKPKLAVQTRRVMGTSLQLPRILCQNNFPPSCEFSIFA
jgi:hypothetical protein